MSEGQSVLTRIKDSLLGLIVMDPEAPGADEINEQKVADTIVTYFGHIPLSPDNPNRWVDYDFPITVVLDKMGFEKHREFSGEADYFKKFPREYKAVRKALTGLTQEGALGMITLEEEDTDSERLHYEVLDEEALREISTSPSSSLAQKT